MCGFAFDRDGLTCFFKPLDVTLDGVFGHRPRVFQVSAFGYEAGQGGDGHCVAAMLVGFEKGVVLVDAIFFLMA